MIPPPPLAVQPQAFIGSEEAFLAALSSCEVLGTSGGKSGASFFRTRDGRFVVKAVRRNEMHMFLATASVYFGHVDRALFDGMPSVLVKVLGAFTVSVETRGGGACAPAHALHVLTLCERRRDRHRHRPTPTDTTAARTSTPYVVMENLFYKRELRLKYDLKVRQAGNGAQAALSPHATHPQGSGRNRYIRPQQYKAGMVLLDDNFLEDTGGFPVALKARAKRLLSIAVHNDTKMLTDCDVIDYSMLVGVDEEREELVVGIIDYLRNYDLLKKIESLGKQVGMLTGQAEPTIIPPQQYKKRFRMAMDRYFFAAPSKRLALEDTEQAATPIAEA